MLSEAVFHMKFIFLTLSKVWQCCQTLPSTYRVQHRQVVMRSVGAGVTKLRLLFVNSQKAADGVFLSEIGFYEFAKPGLAALALVGPDSLDGGRIPAGRTLVTRGLLRANEGLFLASKQTDFLAEFIHQKIQFCHSFGVQLLCVLMAGNLPYVGIDHVDAGVQGMA